MNDRTRPRLHSLAAIIAAAAALVGSTAPARADGHVTRTRAIEPFDRVDVDGAFTVTIEAGSSTAFSMTGRAEDLARVTVRVDGGRLTVGMQPGTTNTRSIVLAVATPALRSFVNQGAGLVHLRGLHGDVDLENRGTATVDASGRAVRLTIVNDGVGKIDASALDARDATVTNDGVGSILVRANGSLVMNVNGIGEIRYAGDPTHVERSVNGFGRIRRL